jgi:hypothetical protein
MRLFPTMRTIWRIPVTRPVALLFFLAVQGASRAEAQYGYVGSFAGYGAGMGMYPADQELLKAQIYALNASQFQLNQTQAEREYWAAMLIREQAISVALSNRSTIEALRGAAAGQPQRGAGAPRPRRAAAPARLARQPRLAQGGPPAAPQREE